MKDGILPKTLRLADRYDHERTADVRAHADRYGRYALTLSQLQSAERRACVLGGSCLVCITPIEQSEICVYRRDGSPYGIVYVCGGAR